MPKRKARHLHIVASTDAAFKTEVTSDYVMENTTCALEAWDQLDIDNYIGVIVRGKDPKGKKRLGIMFTSWDDLRPGDTIAVMGKVLVVQKEED